MQTDILIIQFRTDQSLKHERTCFREASCEFEVDLSFVNAVETDVSELDPRAYSGVILAGSGEFYLSEGHGEESWLQHTFQLLDQLVEYNIPTLGICLGAQILTLHQGGSLTDDSEYSESGSHEIKLTGHSENCNIFSNLNRRFHGALAHQDTPVELPDHFISLAESQSAPYQAFKLENKPIWGTLFHPELNRERLDYRLKLYPSYTESEELYEEIMGDFVDTTHSVKVLHHFYDFVN